MLKNPTSQQRVIFDFVQNGRGHGVVVALAGTGKTTSLVESLNYLPPGARALCCAFNRRIRDELERRAPRHVKVMTLHQLGRATLSATPQFRRWKHDGDKDWEMAERSIEGTDWDDKKKTSRGTRADILERIAAGASLVKATLTATRPALIELIEDFELDCDLFSAEELAPFIAKAVNASLASFPRTSFDDEVWLPVQSGYGLRCYDFVFVDECQDLNLTQLSLVRSAISAQGRVVAIGDPAQAIYQWRGAGAEMVQRITDELQATVLSLSITFRCPKKVVELAKQYAPDFEAGEGAPEGCIEDIRISDLYEQVAPGDFVLSRINAPLITVCYRLIQQGTPARIVGQDVAKNLQAMVMRSKALTVQQLRTWIDTYEAKETARLTKSSRLRALGPLRDRVDTLRSLCDDVFATSEVLDKIDQLFTDDHKSAVICSSVHRIKGEEAARVFVLEETFFLARGDPAEEANIHYVALTRSKSHLFRVTGLYKRQAAANEA